jgi:peptide subunit release factor 1 (eRF1)
MVEETYKKSAAGDLAVIGVDRVVEAANRHAVSQLLVHDGAMMPGAVCPTCAALSHPQTTCGRCGAETKPVPDLIEALTRAVIEATGQVEHVMAKTPLESDLVAAQLRFAIW